MVAQRRVFLHVGAPKTGTTFLQRVLWSNRDALARQGVDVPGPNRGEHMRAGYDLRAVPAAPADPKVPKPEWEGAWSRLAASARESENGTVVISDERLAAASTEEVERAVVSLAPAEVHVVYTAREFVGLLPAAWQEFVKNRFSYDFEAWLADVFDRGRDGEAGAWFWRVQDAADVLDRWGAGVPPQRIHVIPLPPTAAPTALLWERFASLLDIDPGGVDLANARVNSSLSWEQTELLRRVNAALPSDFPERHYFGVVRDLFARDVLQAQTRAQIRPVVPDGRAAEARACSKRLIARLADAGYHVTGDLTELTAQAEPPAPADTAGTRGGSSGAPGPADVRDASVDAITGLLAHTAMMRDRRRQVDQRLDRMGRDLAAARAERDKALARVRRREQRPAGQIGKEALVDLAGCSRTVGLAYRAYQAGRRLARKSRAATPGTSA